ncbi:uncharacterized protein ISCGN_027451 [Ixodes scapularis]
MCDNMELFGRSYGGTWLLAASLLAAIGVWGQTWEAVTRNRTTEDLPIVFPDDNTAAESAKPPRRTGVNASGFRSPPARNEILALQIRDRAVMALSSNCQALESAGAAQPHLSHPWPRVVARDERNFPSPEEEEGCEKGEIVGESSMRKSLRSTHYFFFQ